MVFFDNRMSAFVNKKKKKKGHNRHKNTIALKVAKYIKGHIIGWKKDVLKFPFLPILSNTATSAKLSVTLLGHELGSLGRLAAAQTWESLGAGTAPDSRSPQRAGAVSEVAVQLPLLGNLSCGLGPWGGNEIPMLPLKTGEMTGCLKPQQLFLVLKPMAAGIASFSKASRQS